MKILSHIPFPCLDEHIATIAPNATLDIAADDFFKNFAGEETDASTGTSDGGYTCLLTAPIGVPQLEETLQTFPEIRWVHVFGTGMDTFPVKQVGDRILTCARGASAVPISEWVMAMLLAYEKQLTEIWLKEPPEVWHQTNQLGSLAGKTLALYGFGGIGQAIAKRALAFDMQVKAMTRQSKIDVDGVEQVFDLHALVEDADHIALAAPATASTREVIGSDVLAAVKPGAHLVNIARGSLINAGALREALDNETLAMASLDVVEPEPLPDGHWMFEHPRVRLSPHISWSDPNAFTKLLDSFLENLRRYIHDEPLLGRVDVDAGY